jgi:hypothetical protein
MIVSIIDYTSHGGSDMPAERRYEAAHRERWRNQATVGGANDTVIDSDGGIGNALSGGLFGDGFDEFAVPGLEDVRGRAPCVVVVFVRRLQLFVGVSRGAFPHQCADGLYTVGRHRG